MMNPAQPGLKVREDEMNDRHELFGNLRIAALGDGHMVKAVLGETSVAAPIVSDDSGARDHDGLHEAAQRAGAAVRNHGQPDAARIAATPSRIELGAGLALTDLDRRSHQALVVNASTLSSCTPANPGLIGLDVFVRLAADLVLVGAHHARAQV